MTTLDPGTIDVESWGDFEEKLKLLREENDGAKPGSELLYRGQSDACWSLRTTLERCVDGRMKFLDYYSVIRRMKSEVESFTGNAWTISTSATMTKKFKEYDIGVIELSKGIPAYSYMAHLRHQGFPSPLLDWTRSPYVAAHFAFANADREGKVAIYAYRDRNGVSKRGGSDGPNIHSMGPYVKTDRRHFLQQSQYTFCTVFDGAFYFESHDLVFKRDTPKQDLLWKFNLPKSERDVVLEMLDQYNLNAFSLFASEESLMKTLAARGLERR